jgi:hypothetical protein
MVDSLYATILRVHGYKGRKESLIKATAGVIIIFLIK